MRTSHEDWKERQQMKGIRYVGMLSAAVAMLFMATGASAAFGSEFQTAGKGNPAGVTFTGKGGAATFETEKGTTVTCEKSASSGKLLNGLEAEVTSIKYTGKCTISIGSAECESTGAGKGNITTNTLVVQPGTEIGNKKTRLQDVSAKSGGTLVEFTCGSIKVKVTKSVICENTKPESGVTTTLVCAKKAGGKDGEQKFVEMERDNKEVVKNFLEAEAEVAGIKLKEKDSQTTSETLEFSEAIQQTE